MKKTIVKLTFKYNDKEYEVRDILPYYINKDEAMFIYEDGNYSDDETRADLIRIKYGENEIPKLSLGSDEIQLENIEIEYK